MYAVTVSDDGDCYRCFPPDPGIGTAVSGDNEAPALGASASVLSGASESALSGTVSASASHTFTLDSGASRSFFRDRTTLTPLSRPVAVSLADPSGGPVLSRFSTVLPCPAAPSGTLTGLYLPSFSTNLVSGADLQDVGVHQFTPARQRVTHCTEASTGRHLATFRRQPGSSLYTLTTASPPGAESGRVPSSGQVFAAASRALALPVSPVSRGASVLPLTPPSFLRQRLRCRHFTWTCGALPASVDSVTSATSCWWLTTTRRYTTVFPLRSKGDVTEVLIDWIRAPRLQLRQSFGSDFPVMRLHSDRGGEFSSGLLRAYCRARGICQTFTLPNSPQQNGIEERRIGMVMDVARTSMMHAAVPHFLWPFCGQVRGASDQPPPQGLQAGDLPSPAVDGEGWRCVGVPGLGISGVCPRLVCGQAVPSRCSLRLPGVPPLTPLGGSSTTPPLDVFCPPRTSRSPPVDPLPPQGPAPSGVSQVDAVEPVEVTGDSGAVAGAEPGVLSLGVRSLGGA
ncbi:unnamed protein product [Closterium sp. NIES-64]|nr:unnamed protein product [Closterium sp. NIES-64]